MGSGKTTVAHMISRIMKAAGYHVGTATSDGIYVDSELSTEGNGSEWDSADQAEQVLTNPHVLWLDAPIEVLLARCLTMTGRPLFRDEASFRTLHAERLPSYQLADHRVESSSEPAEIVAQILRLGIVASGGNQTHLVVEKPLS